MITCFSTRIKCGSDPRHYQPKISEKRITPGIGFNGRGSLPFDN
jgi:hypothetical protein